MSARDDLVSALEDGGHLDGHASRLLDAYRAEVLREMAAKIREVGTAKGWSVWAAPFIDPDVEFVDTGMPSTESIVTELRRLDRAEVLREAARAIDRDDACRRPSHRAYYADLLRRMAAETAPAGGGAS